MDLRKLLDTIISSDREDWSHIPCWGARSGPSYHDHLSFCDVYKGQSNVVYVESHPDVAVYIPDLAITIAWGIKCMEDFREPWANQFPDAKASSGFADVFYNNTLVYRDVYVSVDGYRAKLPLPRAGTLEVSEKRRTFFRLVDSMAYVSQFDSYFKRAGFKVIDADWLA